MSATRSKHGLDPAAIAGRIRAERLRLDLTQEGAAAGLAVARGTYRQLEAAANPQASTLVALARLGFNPRAILPELFAGPDEPT